MKISNDTVEGLDEGLRARVAACGSADELRSLAEAEGTKLTDELLEGVAGGDEDDVVVDVDEFPMPDLEFRCWTLCKKHNL